MNPVLNSDRQQWEHVGRILALILHGGCKVKQSKKKKRNK